VIIHAFRVILIIVSMATVLVTLDASNTLYQFLHLSPNSFYADLIFDYPPVQTRASSSATFALFSATFALCSTASIYAAISTKE
ncbi:hypothetical protein A2U01_0001659, partial [Trifolium medium]|nr:hypothetical protein [Trifolium medium]